MKAVTPSVAPLPMHIAASAAPVIPRDRILRLPDVERITGLKKSTIYALAKDKESNFPRQIHIHRRLTGWSEAAVLTWVQSRLQEGGVQ
ncbi:AlpA family transcriptional regulator [Rhodoferax sp. TH121]|uniref:helix-turn-helix transcriptional regulator n=1 Tax=Rhodoferax sp. TH121 TaxID=2022803 RepID=UPI001C3C8C0D|nr:AlpA family phage regulatory protein [Rhodoferax sp. TH121]